MAEAAIGVAGGVGAVPMAIPVPDTLEERCDVDGDVAGLAWLAGFKLLPTPTEALILLPGV